MAMHVHQIEDNPGDVRLIRELLRDQPAPALKHTSSARLSEGLAFVASEQPEIVLLDLNLPDSTGLDTYTSLAETAPLLPVIIISGGQDEELAAQAVAHGAQDYLVKGQVDGFLLRRAIRYAIERKRAEEARRVSEGRYRSLVEASAQLIWTMDASGNVIERLPSWQAFTGQTEEEVLGQGAFEALHPDDRAERVEAWRRAREDERPFELECRVRSEEGTYLDFILRVVPVRGPDGTLREWVGACTNVTELKATARALVRHNENLGLLQLLTAAMNEMDTLDEALHEAVERICGSTDWPVGLAYRVDATGDHLHRIDGGCILDGRLAELGDGAFSTTLARGEGLAGRVLSTGGPVWLSDLERDPHSPRFLGQADVQLTVGLGVPILLRANVVAVLVFYHLKGLAHDPALIETLVQIGTQLGAVAEREEARLTREKIEAQMRQAQKMEAVGRLAGGVAHDFNNILTVIMTEAQLLQASRVGGEDKELKDALEAIGSSAERAAALTRQLLLFSRRDMPRLEVVDPSEVARGIEKMLERLLGEDISLEVRGARDVGRVRADKGQLEQVIFNLAVNARDAMPEGGHLLIEIVDMELDRSYAEHHAGVEPGRYVMIAVSDSGVGMSEELQTRIFEPFFTTKEMGKGTGLGLATSFGIVQGCGGHIGVYSEVGVGTTMKVYLPRSADAEKKESMPVAEPESPRPDRPATVLVVEDQDAVRKVAVRIIESVGYHVLEAANGLEAIQLLEREETPQVDLLFTDVVMPGISGAVTAERALELRPHMKVLFATGYTDEAMRRHGLLEEPAAILSKPYSPAELLRSVRDALGS